MEARSGEGTSYFIGPSAPTSRHRFAAAPALLLSMLVAYGSWLPFDFRLDRLSVGFTFAETNAPDIQTNLLVYLPIGASFALCLMRRRFAGIAAILGATLGASLLSLTVETVQTMLPSRVASWTDVLLNATGSFLGAGIALLATSITWAMLREIRKEQVDRPFTLAGSLLTIGLLVYQIIPCDFITTTTDLHNAFARASWNPFVDSAMSASLSVIKFADDLSVATWFLLLGALLGLSALEARRAPLAGVASAVKRGFALVVTIECLQLFTKSHIADANSVVMRTIALTIGAWSGVFVITDARTRTLRDHLTPKHIWMPVVGALLFAQITLLFLPGMNCWLGKGWNWAAVTLLQLPFESLWRQSGLSGLLDTLGMFVTYATLGASLVILVRGLPIRRPRLVSLGLCLLAAVFTETIRSGSGVASFDTTALPLAWMGGWVGAKIIDAVAAPNHAAPATRTPPGRIAASSRIC